MATVAPMVQILTQLQEENKILNIELERLVRQVEVLCRAKGLEDMPLGIMVSQEVQSKTSTFSPYNPPLGVPQGSVLAPQNFQSSPKEANSSSHDLTQQDVKSPNVVLQETVSDPQDLESSSSSLSLNDPKFYQKITLLNAESSSDLPDDLPQEPVKLDLTQEAAKYQLNSPTAVPQGCVLDPQDFASNMDDGTVTFSQGVPQESKCPSTANTEDTESCEFKPEEHLHLEPAESLAVPHAPVLSPRRSLSAPALMGSAPGNTVPLLLMEAHCNASNSAWQVKIYSLSSLKHSQNKSSGPLIYNFHL